MCGLVAYYKISERPIEAQLLEDMTHAMEHRGPDDYGLCFVSDDGPLVWRTGEHPAPLRRNGVAMGHRRLSVFDLTEAGRQPFLSDDRRFAMVFNGEIYNYVELREELIQHGFNFSTDCDTEVLLKAFEQWGTDCFPRLNGVWGVVIWDNVSKELVVARDRLGEKPLFYTQIDGDWIFASEVKVLLKHPRFVAQPNEQSVMHFIASGASPIGEETFFANVHSLEPGSFVTFRDGKPASKSRFWTLGVIDVIRRTDEQAVEELRFLLTDAVKLRLRGDLHVGAMLSGGMDSTSVISSIVSVLEARISESRSIGDRLEAFTASFPGLENDETDKVEELCRLIEIAAHKVFPAAQERVEESLFEVARSLEAPFWSPAVIVHDVLMKRIQSSDVQIVLDGLGADEILGGFDWYVPLVVRDCYRSMRLGEAVENLHGLKSFHGRSFLKEALRVMLPRSFPSYLDSRLRLMRGQGRHWYSGLFRKALNGRKQTPSNGMDGTLLQRAMKKDLLVNNVPRWVHMGDNISMANSVVCRSPFLDFRLVEFAFSLEDSLKIRRGVTKYILREAKRDQLPSSIVEDCRKVQFQGPGPQWLQGPLKAFAQSLRSDKNCKLSNFLHRRALTEVIDGFYSTKQVSSYVMWRLLNAEAWLRAYF